MTITYRALTLAAMAAVAGCSQTDPVLTSRLWNPAGVNETNIAAMVASPSDLVRGVDEPGSDGIRAAVAVQRLETNRVKALPNSGLIEVKLQDNGGGQGSEGASAAGGGT